MKEDQPFGYEFEFVKISVHITSFFICMHHGIADVSQMLENHAHESPFTVRCEEGRTAYERVVSSDTVRQVFEDAPYSVEG